ncbi:MAG TPA: 2-polyprenyl-3-methyl-6-methoxy-1,4-benzoquinone monooxygenase [Burkholderiales bacterium]|nr:2-polyprenyl-3-methyl-6-methoxy-1,4-benzoquinone monooxygenase [Burkholderiales bacterium]
MSGPARDADRLILGFDRALRTVCGVPISSAPLPAADVSNAPMTDAERRHAAALMRVNHAGEVCAQALYQGQALTARRDSVRAALEQAAREESDHLAWTAEHIDELGGRVSVLNPFFYLGAFAVGAVSGVLGDRWNLGFLAETERQVEGHLEGHLDRLPAADARGRAILARMKADEARHAATARGLGAAELSGPVKTAMRIASKVMTHSTYFL